MQKNSILMFAFLILTVSVVSAFAQTNSKKQMSAEAVIEETKVVIKVVAVKDNVVSTSGIIKPDDGNKFVSIQIVMDNTKGEDEWNVKPEKFILRDEEGSIYETRDYFSSSSLTQPTLKSGVVDGGDFVKGWVTFQVGSGVNLKSLKLRYEDSGGYVAKSAVKSGWIALSAVLK